MGVLRHGDKAGPGFFAGHAHDFDDAHHLVPLKRNGLFAIHFCFFAFEDRTQGEEFCEDTPYSPQVDGGCVMAASHKEFRGTVPDRDDDFVAREEGVKWFIEEAGEAQIANTNCAAGGY